MIDIELAIRNYRCFGDEPTHIRIADGFTAIVGVNNSGKSSLLRLLYEIRPLLRWLGESGDGRKVINGGGERGRWNPILLEGERVLRADVKRDVELNLVVRDGPNGPFVHDGEQLPNCHLRRRRYNIGGA